MGEPSGRIERRPPHIPKEWLTRQQAQTALKLRSPTALAKLLEQFKPGPDQFQLVGRTGYLSPAFVQQLELDLAQVEDIRDLPGYMSGTTALEVIECSSVKFAGLVLENPPSVQSREVVKARNHNSEVNPVYSPQYIDRLRRLYKPPAPRRIGQESGGAPPDTERPSHALAGKVLARIDAATEPNLVDPDRAKRDQLLVNVREALSWLERQPQRQSLEMTQLIRQLYDASESLRGNAPLPRGVESLLDHVDRIRYRDE